MIVTPPISRRNLLAFLWIALIPVAFTLVAFWIGREFQSEIAAIMHTYEIRNAIRDAVMLTSNSERDLESYIQTGRASYLGRFASDSTLAPKRLDELQRLIANNPVQQENLARFRPLVENTLAKLRQTLAERQASGRISELTVEEVDHFQEWIDEVRTSSRVVMQEEERLLLARGRLGSRMLTQVEIIFGSAITLTLLLLFWAGRLAKQKVDEVEALNRDLEQRIEERTAALRESTEHSRILASIVESSEDAIVGKALDGTIRTWNAGAERLYGYRSEEILGHNVRELLPPDRLDEELRMVERVRNGERVEHFESTFRSKSGKLIDVGLTISPIRDETGQIVGASHVARDITEQKRSAELMREAQKLESLGVMAGGIAHDFNNLLVGILGNASLALDQLASGSPLRGPLQEVVAAGERAASLTHQMLAYSGRGRFVLSRIDLSSQVRETVPLIQAAMPRTVELDLDLAPDLPAIEGDSTQVQQLIMNLVINGAEAIAEGRPGTVSITTRVQDVGTPLVGSQLGELKPGSYVSLEVRDTGCGMDEATRARIFEPFFTTKFTGRGLGLAAVLGIVRGHSGWIQVSSNPGAGTAFRVLLPALAEAVDQTPPDRGIRSLEGRGTILVIDDEQIVRRMARQALEHYGYQVVLAEDGRRGLETFQTHDGSIDCVVLDLTMPVMSGEETLEQLEALHPRVPVILTSGFSEAEALRRFEGKELAGFIEKPYKATALAEKVKEAIRRGKAPSRAAGS